MLLKNENLRGENNGKMNEKNKKIKYTVYATTVFPHFFLFCPHFFFEEKWRFLSIVEDIGFFKKIRK